MKVMALSDAFTNGRNRVGLRETMHVVSIHGLQNNKEILAGPLTAAPEITIYEALTRLRASDGLP